MYIIENCELFVFQVKIRKRMLVLGEIDDPLFL
jgi:hypothetical protein